jgi:hypothetical protein
VRPPITKEKESYYEIAGWAAQTYERRGWEHRIAELCQFDVIRIDHLKRTRTYEELAWLWRSFKAADSDYVFDQTKPFG